MTLTKKLQHPLELTKLFPLVTAAIFLIVEVLAFFGVSSVSIKILEYIKILG